MISKDDWRLNGNQANYLHGELLRFGPYRPRKQGCEHDHCEFCFRRFSSAGKVNFAWEGFYTEDKRWICEACYDDFKVLFDWALES
ncbi:MAG: hypothetical protein ACJ79Y_17260 [Myxococcales bacterium]